MEQSNRELITEVADLFKDYEEPYVPGEWEAFQQITKKKYPLIPQWLRIAAVLFLTISILPFALKKVFRKHENVISRPAVKAPAAERMNYGGLKNPGEGNKLQKTAVKERLVYKKPAIVENAKLTEMVSAPNIVTVAKIDDIPVKESGIIILPEDKLPESNLMDTTNYNPVKATLSTSEFLLAESSKPTPAKKKSEQVSKWDFGLQVMPTATRSAMNFSAGLVTGYRISDKLSVSSGISIVQLGAGENIALSNPSVSSVDVLSYSGREISGGGQRVRVDAQLSAIDIPLGLVYKLNKNYFTSAGVSYFNVLSEKRSNTFLRTQSVNKSSTDQLTGEISQYSTLETRGVNESSPDQPLKGNSYLGFFNFSFGRRQQIFKQYSFQVEPFVKVPIGKLSNQEVNLMNTGLKFQLSF